MKSKPPVFYIYILILCAELITIILLCVTLKEPAVYAGIIYRLFLFFGILDVILAFAVEIAKDILRNESIVIKDFFSYRIRNFGQIYTIGVAKLKQRYKGTTLGWAWALIRPAIYIVVYWFAIVIGLRSGRNIDGCPYHLWLTAGFVPWFYIRDMITFGAGSFRNNAYLLRVAKFPIITIPAITNVSLIPVHIVLVIIMSMAFCASGYSLSIYWIQLPLYMVMMFVFFDFWGLFAGVVSVVNRDFLNLVNSLIVPVMWLSGIFYNIKSFDNEIVEFIFKMNPISIIVTGYRNCFIDKVWFYQDLTGLANYLLALLLMMFISIKAYKKFGKIIPDLL